MDGSVWFLNIRLFRVCLHSGDRVPTERTIEYKVSWGLVLELALYYFLLHSLFQSKSQGQQRRGQGKRLHLLVRGAAESHFKDYRIRNEWIIKANLQPVYHSHLCFSRLQMFWKHRIKIEQICIYCVQKKKKERERCFPITVLFSQQPNNYESHYSREYQAQNIPGIESSAMWPW